jgi:predicted nucleotidyltransferase
MYQDFKDLLSAFRDHVVKYLIVGGDAVSFYGQPRATQDIDLFVEASAENAKAVYSALATFGAPMKG